MFPEDEALQKRMLLVGNLPKAINPDQVCCSPCFIHRRSGRFTQKAVCCATCTICRLNLQHVASCGMNTLMPCIFTLLCACVQLKQLFGFCGSVSECNLAGKSNDYAIVEFSKEEVQIESNNCPSLPKLNRQ